MRPKRFSGLTFIRNAQNQTFEIGDVSVVRFCLHCQMTIIVKLQFPLNVNLALSLNPL